MSLQVPYVDRTSEKELLEALQVGYESAKDSIKTPLIDVVGEVIVDISFIWPNCLLE